MLPNRLLDQVASRLPDSIRPYYRRCLISSTTGLTGSLSEAEHYLTAVREKATTLEFQDTETAEKVFQCCGRLWQWVEQQGSAEGRAAVEAAVRYFVLEEDAEGDDSIIGFDDDLLVVEATASVLGVVLDD